MQVREFDLNSLDKLLPCPFCGGDAELDTHQAYRNISTGDIGHRVAVYCTKCDADMGTCIEDVPDIHPNEVIERWNTRAAAALLREMSEREVASAKAVWFVQHIAKQSDAEAVRADAEDECEPDFEGGYDHIVHMARDIAKALPPQPEGT